MASLKYRRLRARGLNSRLARIWGGRYFAGIGNRATLTVGTGNARQTFFARTPGTSGNAISVRYVVAGNNTPLSVSVAGSAITVNVATNGAGAATSTAADVRNALNFDKVAGPLIWTEPVQPGSDGTGIVAAFGPTNLAGAV